MRRSRSSSYSAPTREEASTGSGESTAEYFRQLEELRESGARVGCAPTPSARARRTGSRDRRLCPAGAPAAARPRRRAAPRDRRVPRGARCPADRAPLPYALPGPRTTVVHATHADDHGLDLLAEAGARVCICPTTEANLGDGFAPLERLRERGIGICIGSDSNVRIDPLEELRELETTARRETLSREVVDAGPPLLWRRRRRIVTRARVVAGHRCRPRATVASGVHSADVLDTLVFGCSADVFVELADADPGGYRQVLALGRLEVDDALPLRPEPGSHLAAAVGRAPPRPDRARGRGPSRRDDPPSRLDGPTTRLGRRAAGL